MAQCRIALDFDWRTEPAISEYKTSYASKLLHNATSETEEQVASYTITSWTTLRALVLGVWRPSARVELSWMNMFGVPVVNIPGVLVGSPGSLVPGK